MTLTNQSILNHSTAGMLGSVDSVNFNATAQTTLFTVPPGKKCVLNYVRIRNVTADMALADCTVGQVGALTDFLGTRDLALLNAAATTGILAPIPAVNVVKGIEYTAGEVIQIDVTSAVGGACTATVELFGTLDDA